MAEFSSHIPGTFSWVELATTDQKAAVAFYRALLGWGIDEQPMGPDEVYSMFTLRDKHVAAAYTMRTTERQSGVPPHWSLYVTVANAGETASRAQSLGGRVIAPAFDVMDAGRSAVLQGPTGGMITVWEPKKNIGAKILSEPGALCWSELTTTDLKTAEEFYVRLFGWTAKHSAPAAVMDYTEIHNQGTPAGGMMAMPAGMPSGLPSYWMPYFQVVDCDATTDKAKALGATVMVSPNDIPNTGRFSVICDPQAAMFAAFTLSGALT